MVLKAIGSYSSTIRKARSPKSTCWQNDRILSGGSRGESSSLPFPAPGACQYSSDCGCTAQVYVILVTLPPPCVLSSVCLLFHVSLIRALVIGFRAHPDGKAPVCNAGDLDLIPGSGRSPGEGNGNPLQYSCLENPMDREAW